MEGRKVHFFCITDIGTSSLISFINSSYLSYGFMLFSKTGFPRKTSSIVEFPLFTYGKIRLNALCPFSVLHRTADIPSSLSTSGKQSCIPQKISQGNVASTCSLRRTIKTGFSKRCIGQKRFHIPI